MIKTVAVSILMVCSCIGQTSDTLGGSVIYRKLPKWTGVTGDVVVAVHVDAEISFHFEKTYLNQTAAVQSWAAPNYYEKKTRE